MIQTITIDKLKDIPIGSVISVKVPINQNTYDKIYVLVDEYNCNCNKCIFNNTKHCETHKICSPFYRDDLKDVYFKQVNINESYDPIIITNKNKLVESIGFLESAISNLKELM